MAIKFTKGGLLNTTQLQNLSGKKWKKGGILSAKQLNELSNGNGGGSDKICVINERTLELDLSSGEPSASIQIDNTNITSGIFTAKLNGVEFPALGGAVDENGVQSIHISILSNDEMGKDPDLSKPKDIIKIYWESTYPDNTAEVEIGEAYIIWATMYAGFDPSSFGPGVDPSTLVIPVPTVSVFVEPTQENEFLIIELVKEDGEWTLKEDVNKVLIKLYETASMTYSGRSLFKLDDPLNIYAIAGQPVTSKNITQTIGGKEMVVARTYRWHSSIYTHIEPGTEFADGSHIVVDLAITEPISVGGYVNYTLTVNEVPNSNEA